MIIRKEEKTKTYTETEYTIQCDICKKVFTSRWENRCCSNECYEKLKPQLKKEAIKRSTQHRKWVRDEIRAELADHTCVHCSEPFRPVRSDAMFCSPACKQASYRQKKKVIHEPTIPTTVVHCMRDKYDIYIGRANTRSGLSASKWENPFPLPNKASEEQRAACIEKYKQWFFTQPELIAAIPELKGKVLGCWCKPKACHGDFLAELADNAQLRNNKYIISSISVTIYNAG